MKLIKFRVEKLGSKITKVHVLSMILVCHPQIGFIASTWLQPFQASHKGNDTQGQRRDCKYLVLLLLNRRKAFPECIPS
jgi:hypothetical protein